MEWRWSDPVDGYCERIDPSFWAEPVNALTNAAFLVVALVMWSRCAGLAGGRLLAAVLLLIGLGSFAFHTAATRVAAMADVLPILAFVVIYVFLTGLRFWGWRPWQAALATPLQVAALAGMAPLIGRALPWLGGSAGYAPLPLLILAHAALLRRRAPATARGLAIGAGLLALSIGFRALDLPLCDVWPRGTHFLWHLVNAAMLGWMTEIYRRHMLAGQTTAR